MLQQKQRQRQRRRQRRRRNPRKQPKPSRQEQNSVPSLFLPHPEAAKKIRFQNRWQPVPAERSKQRLGAILNRAVGGCRPSHDTEIARRRRRDRRFQRRRKANARWGGQRRSAATLVPGNRMPAREQAVAVSGVEAPFRQTARLALTRQHQDFIAS